MWERLRAAWAAFKHPKAILHTQELRELVQQMYQWTNYKDTRWAVRVRKALEIPEEEST